MSRLVGLLSLIEAAFFEGFEILASFDFEDSGLCGCSSSMDLVISDSIRDRYAKLLGRSATQTLSSLRIIHYVVSRIELHIGGTQHTCLVPCS
jgi:hypothetical protein